ncbi:pyruvoyl-dependent arginine decarboxylase [Natrialbaceae archaeon A-CW1-1]
MSTIRVVWGSATAPTKMASYDAALADAGVENYNLVTVSSVIPADADVDPVGTAPNLGSIGNRLTVVEARATTASVGSASAALAWVQSDHGRGPGLFYETAGEEDSESVEARVLEGLDAGQDLRDWAFDDPEVRVETVSGTVEGYATAVVLAVYGESEPIC